MPPFSPRKVNVFYARAIKRLFDLAGQLQISNLFLKFDWELEGGILDYTGPNLLNGKSVSLPSLDIKSDNRLLIGKDLLIGKLCLSPYSGLGYRGLFTAPEEVRLNQSIYAPIGLEARMPAGKDGKVSLGMEYDKLILGEQFTAFDPGNLFNVVTQHDGNGLRFSLMYETGKWAIGAFTNYWNVGASTTFDTGSKGRFSKWYEPPNSTQGIGFGATLRF